MYEELKKLAEVANNKCDGSPWAYEPHGDTGEFGVGVLEDYRGNCVTGRQSCCEILVFEPVAPEVSGESYASFIAAANPSAVLALIEENEKIRGLLAEKLIGQTMLTGIIPENSGMAIGLEGGACAIMADVFGEQLYASAAENYIELSFASGKYPELGQIVVTVKRETGKTPHQLRAIAEQDRDSLKAENARSTEREILQLAEIESLRKDAERYRWLRDKSEAVHKFYLSVPIWFSGVKFRKEDVDSTIDDTMNMDASQ